MNRSVVIATSDREIDRRIILVADTLEAAGWHVMIVAMPTAVTSSEKDQRVIRLKVQPSNVARTWLAMLYRAARRMMPRPVSDFVRYMGLRFVADPEAYFFNLYSGILSNMQPDVFIAVDLPVLGVTRYAAENAGARLVYDSHELFTEQEQSNWEKARWRQIEDENIRSCDAVITVNRSIAHELEQRYSLPPVSVVHNAVRLPAVLGRARIFHDIFGLPADVRIVLLQGGLSAGRNLDGLIEAMRFVRTPAVHLIVLGNGEVQQNLKSIARRFGLIEKVHFHPAVSQDKLLSYTAAADLGIIPYRATCLNNFLCTPNKLFEYIAAGIPIVSSDLPEIRRIVVGHNIGLVGDMGSAENIAALIDDCFESQPRMRRWHSNLQSVREILSWQQEEKTVLKVFDALKLDVGKERA